MYHTYKVYILLVDFTDTVRLAAVLVLAPLPPSTGLEHSFIQLRQTLPTCRSRHQKWLVQCHHQRRGHRSSSESVASGRSFPRRGFGPKYLQGTYYQTHLQPSVLLPVKFINLQRLLCELLYMEVAPHYLCGI